MRSGSTIVLIVMTAGSVCEGLGRVAMIIPHRLLSPDAVRGVIDAFVTREGTDYGAHDVPAQHPRC